MGHKKIVFCDSCLVCNKVDSIKKMNDENGMHKNFLSCPEQFQVQPLTYIQWHCNAVLYLVLLGKEQHSH